MTTIAQTFSDDPMVKEVERTFLFTDVPSGAMKFRKEDEQQQKQKEQQQPVAEDDMSAQITSFCGVLEKTFCFSDLEDINEEDIQRIKSMKSLEAENNKEVPAVQPADTESCSDDSAEKLPDGSVKHSSHNEDGSVVKVPDLTLAPAPLEHPLPPSNGHQASNRKLAKNGKPVNNYQATRLANKKKADKKKKSGWGFFRRSKTNSKKATKAPSSSTMAEL